MAKRLFFVHICFLPPPPKVMGEVWLTTSWHQFKSDCQQTSSVIPLATGDEVIKFWKVRGQGKNGGGVMCSTERLSTLFHVFNSQHFLQCSTTILETFSYSVAFLEVPVM